MIDLGLTRIKLVAEPDRQVATAVPGAYVDIEIDGFTMINPYLADVINTVAINNFTQFDRL